MKNLLGKAIYDYYKGDKSVQLITETNISEEDEFPLPYLFRTYNEMPELEQKALDLCRGKILDVGCGAGSHALYLQDETKMDVEAIDISEESVITTGLRGVKKVAVCNVFELKDKKYDTILLLMNGTGLFGTLNQVYEKLQILKSLLNPNGQILIDSSDIIYMFDEDEDGGKWIPADGYYGELSFTVKYKNHQESFPWLYLDYNTLLSACEHCGLNCELVYEGEHFDYLARITEKR